MLFEIAQGMAQASLRESENRATQFRNKAILALQDAAKLGHTDFVTIENEIDFRPIQSAPEFIALIGDLKSKAATAKNP